MRLGTPGFVGARLREARVARGISGPALAQILGISKAVISQYENEQVSPGPEILRRLSVVLNQPEDFFLKRHDRHKGNVFFRSRAGTSAASRERAEVLLDWLDDIVQEVCRTLRFPTVTFPTFDPPSDPALIDLAVIEEAATEARRFWGLRDGPISNVVWLLENKGAIVTRGEIEERFMDSFSRYDPDDEKPLVFLNADKSSAVRSRFDAAHELGHCILHRKVPKDYWSTNARIHMREEQADLFAAAFLLPRVSFASDVIVPSLESFLALKRKWLVSVGAMLHRAKDIGLIDDDRADLLWKNRSRRNWQTREPLDDELPPEIPKLLPKAIQALGQRNALAPSELVKSIPLSEADAAFLMMLPPDEFLELPDPKVVPFRRKTP